MEREFRRGVERESGCRRSRRRPSRLQTRRRTALVVQELKVADKVSFKSRPERWLDQVKEDQEQEPVQEDTKGRNLSKLQALKERQAQGPTQRLLDGQVAMLKMPPRLS